MPFPSSPRARSGPRRRSLLAVGPAALALAGCTAGGDGPGDPEDSPSAADRPSSRAFIHVLRLQGSRSRVA
ncbi:hypothetical protein ACWDZW_42760, partial [Streptomyces coeruleorubidus]